MHFVKEHAASSSALVSSFTSSCLVSIAPASWVSVLGDILGTGSCRTTVAAAAGPDREDDEEEDEEERLEAEGAGDDRALSSLAAPLAFFLDLIPQLYMNTYPLCR